MNSESWQRLQDLFDAAVAIPVAERESWLTTACHGDARLLKEIRALLTADDDRSANPLTGSVRHALLSLGEGSVPQRIGPYQLLDEIGRGGMGVVFKARRDDGELAPVVAIKLIRPQVADSFLIERFRQEQQILARLRHPSIARLLDGGATDEGTPYIVMEFIDGACITEYCESKRLDIRSRLELFLPVCSAVDYAHHHLFGEYCCVAHLDIKPNNILIDASGTPKLLDFGISRFLYADDRVPESPLPTDVAMTPDYASPEQRCGELITTRSDVYSLGIVLYELLTGVRAHRMNRLTPRAIGGAVCTSDIPPPSAVATDGRVPGQLSRDLDAVVMRAIQSEPRLRYESAAALADDIRQCLGD